MGYSHSKIRLRSGGGLLLVDDDLGATSGESVWKMTYCPAGRIFPLVDVAVMRKLWGGSFGAIAGNWAGLAGGDGGGGGGAKIGGGVGVLRNTSSLGVAGAVGTLTFG